MFDIGSDKESRKRKLEENSKKLSECRLSTETRGHEEGMVSNRRILHYGEYCILIEYTPRVRSWESSGMEIG